MTACNKCNGRKGHLRLSELHRVGMELKTKPRCPSLFELASSATKFGKSKLLLYISLSEMPVNSHCMHAECISTSKSSCYLETILGLANGG